MILKSLDKNLKHKIRFYQNFIVYKSDSVSFKKISRKFFEIFNDFFFFLITMAHTTQNSSKKTYNEIYKLWVLKIANFISN